MSGETAPALLFGDDGTKGEECQLHKFKALNAARDSDNSDKIQNCENEINYRHFPTREYRPENVRNRVLVEIQHHLLAVWGEGKSGCLEALESERDSDD